MSNAVADAEWSLLDCVLSREDADDVFSDLISAAAALGFDSASLWDVCQQPPDRSHFFVRRLPQHSGRRPDADRELLSLENLTEGVPQWFPHGTLSKGRLCVPIVEWRGPAAVWCLDREGREEPASDELDRFRRFARIIGLKISEIARMRIVESTRALLHEYNPDDPDNSALRHICRTLNASLAAVFEIDPIASMVRKVSEVTYEGKVLFDASRKDPDCSYPLGESLTGCAAVDEAFATIPSYDRLCDAKAELRDARLERHVKEATGERPSCFLYRRFSVPGGSDCLLRLINRTDRPELAFAKVHEEILDRLTQPYAQLICARQASKRLESLWEIHTNILADVQGERTSLAAQPGLKRLSALLAESGFPITLISIWTERGVLRSVWSNNDLLSNLANQTRVLEFPTVRKLGEPAIVNASALPREFARGFEEIGTDLVYLVPTESEPEERYGQEIVVAIFPLSIGGASDPEYWSARPNLLTYLSVAGRLVATGHSLSRNRGLLFLAEQAVGTMGHEALSPATRLQNTAKLAVTKAEEALRELRRSGEIALEFREKVQSGSLVRTRIDGADQLRRWLREKNQELDQAAHFLEKVVQNAVKWARLSSKTVEAHFELIELHALLDECIMNLAADLVEKPNLTIRVSPKVEHLPPLVADRFYLEILLTNLLDNAIKYSWARGADYEEAVAVNIAQQQRIIDIEIVNWGIGIAQEDYENIFFPFYRPRVRDAKHTVRGVGLGLATCRRIARMHGGDIRVVSRSTLDDPRRRSSLEGYETTFTVRLPTTLNEGRRDFDQGDVQ